MRKIASWGRDRYPCASKIIANDRYVDDILHSCSDVSDIIRRRDVTTELLGKFGFEIKDWKSNHYEVGTIEENGKVLGLRWDAKKDVMSIQLQKVTKPSEFTKRYILPKIAEVWDPLGLLSGILVVGKLIFQSVVRMKVDWDEKIEDIELSRKWINWLSELEKCYDVILARSILQEKGLTRLNHWDLIGFSDGSSVAHGCTLYIMWYDDDEKQLDVKFIGSKCKVNTIKGTIVPRAEMCGAFLLSRLAHSAEISLKDSEMKFQYKDKHLFTDSTTVLSWIRSSSINLLLKIK